MSSKTYYSKDDKLYEYYHGILVPVEKIKSSIPISYEIQDDPYVRRPRRGKAFYDDNFYYKLVDRDGLEVYERLGKRPNFPSLHDYWSTGDKYMIQITKLPGNTVYADQLGNISSRDYYSVVDQALSSLSYIHTLGIELEDRASPDNSLYDSATNTFYHIDIDESSVCDKQPVEFYDTISVIFMLLWIRDSSIEEYRGEATLDDEDFFITDQPKAMKEYLRELIDSNEDSYMVLAYEMMLRHLNN